MFNSTLSCILTGLITWRYNSNFAPFQTKTNNMLSVEKFIFMLFPIAVILVMAYSLHDWQLLALLVLMVIIHKMFLYFLTLFHNGCLLISHNARPSGLDWKVFSSSCLPKKFREDWSFGGLTYKISGIPDGEWPQSHNKVRVIFLWIIHCDKDYLSQFSQFSVVTSQYNGQFSSSYYIFVLIIYCFMQKCHIHIDFKLPFIVSIKLKSSQGCFLSILNSQVHSVHSSNYSTLSNHRHVKKITCLAFSLAFLPSAMLWCRTTSYDGPC